MGTHADRTSGTTPGRDFTAASRDALVEALLSAGPGRPTLCEGWNTEHLAAHIVLRENSPLVAGLLFPPLARSLERRTKALGDSASTPDAYQRLTERVAAGPQPPARLRGHARTAGLSGEISGRLKDTRAARKAAQATNLLEFFVHTEDVRRAQDRWAPRHLADDYANALFAEFTRRARLMYRSEPTGVVLARSTGQRVVARPASRDGSSRTIAGPAGELVMHGFGRRGHALVLVD
ncbi:TIGR03085 family metal-binding protein [Citricoccus sp. I39-566]|uniref:TIGR03085 family metal-binding protein n=1 Tax=Citricoccus sp. I39-566 TaxID=3073268 RepID=UPI00286C0AC0|nr:TIGR03085 family metal-binding protein [Citricoccus sp. I39-566]WMY77270.1 TIGR03085 family metal-binding protein [Citricoccus sp. I39-566]